MKQIVVTAGVFVENDRILMAQRRAGSPEAGKWEFPGGKVELGEEPRRCLKRELEEELGIDAAVNQVLEVISETSDNHLILIYFSCNILHGEPTPLECQQVRWFTPEEVEMLEKPPADERFWVKFSNSPTQR